MDYEKKYKNALEKAKSMIDDLRKGEDILAVSDLEEMFPELKESEDERIRKALLRFHASTIDIDGIQGKEILAWLEKQGKSTTIDIDKMVLKYSQTREPCTNGLPVNCQIRAYRQGINDVLNLSLNLEKQCEQPSAIRWYDVSLIPQEMEELLVEWDSEDATWHEIAFYHADTKTFWNGTRQVENVTRWCYIIDLLEKQGEQKPIVNDNAKEMFIKALERVEEQNAKGYKLTDCDKNSWWEDFKNYTSCTIEQKPTGWSEKLIADVFEMVGLAKIVREQENDALTRALQFAMIELAKYSVVPQIRQEWSEEDENWFNEVWRCVSKEYPLANSYIFQWLKNRLKSLKPQNRWKPSDEQMDALNNMRFAVEHFGPSASLAALDDLYNQLEKLREE